MVTTPSGSASPLDVAAAMGRRLATAAITADGRATWLTDEIVPAGNVWQRRARTLGAGLASGTAGVGWTLARLAAATGDKSIAHVAVAAVRHALASRDRLVAEGELGFHDGASGVVWAAREASDALAREDLRATVRSATAQILDAMRHQPAQDREPGLAHGLAGMLTALLFLSDQGDEAGALETAAPIARQLCEGVRRWTGSDEPPSRAHVGLMSGASGIGAALMSWSNRTADAIARQSAEAAFRLERAWHDDRLGWFGGESGRPHSWGDGAAGIGLARLWAYAATGDCADLAEAGAAIETLRTVPAAEIREDASLGFGAAGHMELLVSAGSILAEPAHVEAARRTLPRVLTASVNPTLFTGTAGVALTLLRLHDPALAPSPLMPPLPRRVATSTADRVAPTSSGRRR